jgi:hypothetical protein
MALLVDAGAILLGKDAEVVDQLIGGCEAASPIPEMVTTWTWGERGKSAKAAVNNCRSSFSAFWQ